MILRAFDVPLDTTNRPGHWISPPQVLGPLMKSEKFNDEIQLVIKASHEAYAGQASFVATGLSRVCAGFLFVGQAATKLAKVENRLLH